MNNPKRFWQQFSNSSLLHFLLLFACGWAIVQLIQYFYSVIAIFTIAATLATLLNYPVRWLTRLVPRGWAIAIVFLIALSTIVTLISIIGFEVITQGQELATSLFDFFQTTNIFPIRKFLDAFDVSKAIETLQTGLLSSLGLLQSLFSNFITFIFVAVLCVYMLIDGDRLWLTVLKIIPANQRPQFAIALQKSFLGFFRAQFILVLFLALSCLIAFSILGVKYALVLCLILGIIDAIPGIGGTLCAIVVTLLVFLSQGTWMAVKVLITCTVLQQIQDNLLSPKLLQDQLNINPVFLFLALFIGERIAGLLGVFLAVPIAAMIASWIKECHQPIESSGSQNI